MRRFWGIFSSSQRIHWRVYQLMLWTDLFDRWINRLIWLSKEKCREYDTSFLCFLWMYRITFTVCSICLCFSFLYSWYHCIYRYIAAIHNFCHLMPYMHVYIYIYMFLYIDVYVYVCIYTYICMYICTYICMYNNYTCRSIVILSLVWKLYAKNM